MLIYRHEKRLHPNFVLKNDNEEQTPDNPIAKPDDHIYNYHCGKLKFGLILFEFNDAVKEGDGQRIYDLYKIALLLYKSGGHYKYAYVVLLYLVKIVSLYTEFGAFQLKWNRFYNKYGLIGKCISLDLKKEQQNKILKRIWRGLGPNLCEDSASRTARALQLLEELIHSIDSDCGLVEQQGYRSSGKQDETVQQIVSDLNEIEAFRYTPSRQGHISFPTFPKSLIKIDYRDLQKWMKDKISLWGSIYERKTVPSNVK